MQALLKMGKATRYSLLLPFLIFLLGFSSTAGDPISQFNQSSTVNLTGIASTIIQAEIDARLNFNSDGLTWDLTEVSPPAIVPIVFSTQQVEALATTPLDLEKFVVAWCDEGSKSINFKIYSTAGDILVNTVTVDTSPGVADACDYHTVSVAALNSTHFVIAWFDASEQDVTFAVYDFLGRLSLGPIDEDTAVGTNSWGVSVSAFNSTHIVIGYYDYADQDATFSTWNLATSTRVAGPIDVDTGVSTDCYNVHVAALNSTHFAFFYYDAGATDDATFAIYTITGTAVKTVTDEDTNIGNSYSLALTALNATHFVVAYYDAADADITFSIYNSAGTRVVGPIDEDTNVGTSGAFVSVAALNSTHFVIAYYDTVDAQHTFSIYNSAGTRVVGPIDVSSVASGMKWLSVTSYLAGIDLGICNSNWIFAEVNATNSARFFTFDMRGNTWNGYCTQIYSLSAEHNATVSYLGNLNEIDVLINLTSSVDDEYSISIYSFSSNTWETCTTVSVPANTYIGAWCNITTAPQDFISPNNEIVVRINSTPDADQATLKEEYVQFFIHYEIRWLEVNYTIDSSINSWECTSTSPCEFPPYSTFLVKASVTCHTDPPTLGCGEVYGGVRYNQSGSEPDTLVSTTPGAKPFFVQEQNPQNPKTCGTLNNGESCNLSWILNAAGDTLPLTSALDILFSSASYGFSNHTATSFVKITSPAYISGTLSNVPICFGSVSGGNLEVNASDGSKVECGTGIQGFPMLLQIESNVNVAVWLRGDTNLVSDGNSISVTNLRCANTSSPQQKISLRLGEYVLFQDNLGSGSITVPVYWWLFVPAGTAPATYTGNISVLVNATS